MSASSGEVPGRLVLDAGPLIALMHARDDEHEAAASGLRQLVEARVRLVAPLPIIFEVYKWLLRESGPTVARRGLTRMREGLEIAFPGPDELAGVAFIVEQMPAWGGTLEDALVALTALDLSVPVWTLNYRDLSAFSRLRFWTPSRG